MPRLLALAALLFALPAQAVVNIDWVTVGDPGNAGDPQSLCSGCSPGTTFGAVFYTYRVGKYEVTNAQYTEFLNAVAATDPNELYHTNMDGPGATTFGGIMRSGNSGSYTYSTITTDPGEETEKIRGYMPVNWVSYFDALRFVNWLHNGQPTGAQDGTTTEDGAYTFSGATSVGLRNSGATIFLTSEDEWYKAAYYDTGAMAYFDYPAGSDFQTSCTGPGPTANTANCFFAAGDLTYVGSYTSASSPNGTFDQGGNVREWSDTINPNDLVVLRGGGFDLNPVHLRAAVRGDGSPTYNGNFVGFRVASRDYPVPALSPIGLLVVAAGLLGFSAYLRRRA